MDLLAFVLKKGNARLAMTITLETLSHLRTKIATINVPAIQDATSTPTMIQAMNKYMTNVYFCHLAVQKHLVDLDATLETSIATSPFQRRQHQRQQQRQQQQSPQQLPQLPIVMMWITSLLESKTETRSLQPCILTTVTMKKTVTKMVKMIGEVLDGIEWLNQLVL